MSASLLLSLTSACAAKAPAEGGLPLPQDPRAVLFDLPVSADSALQLAKHALGAIEGVVQLPKHRPQRTTIANHHLRNRRGGGQTQVAVIAVIDREPSGSHKRTSLELSVWVLDIPHQLSAAQRRAGIPSTSLTTNTPAFRYPRPMSPKDSVYWRSLEHVAEVLVQYGATRRR